VIAKHTKTGGDPPPKRYASRAPQPSSSDINCGLLRYSIRFFVHRANRFLSQDWTSSPLHQSTHLLRYFAFALVGANPGISLIALARYIVIDKSRVSELVDSMEREDLVERRRMSEDHRSQGLFLTPNGITRLSIMSKEIQVYEQKIQELYSDEEHQQLIALLNRIHA